MHIVTFTRSTPDTAAKVEVGGDGAVTWGDAATVVNPWDEYSLEETIRQTDAVKGDSTVVAIGGELHNDALKHSLAMGVKNAARVNADNLDVTDSLQWASLAAGAVNKIDDVQLVIFGKDHVDVGSDAATYQTARKLGWTMLSYVSQILELDADAGTIKVEKTLEQGKQVITAQLPVVISVLKGINEPRYPSFIGIRKASKATIPEWTPTDLGVELPTSSISMDGYNNPPPKDITSEMIDGDSIQEKVAKLADKLMEEKVL
ncbi:MAG: electron transfer flavoprotein subunit beta/FixA family protein [Chloroflexota bacterium]